MIDYKEKACLRCGEMFKPKNSKGKHCCKAITLVCEVCGAEFEGQCHPVNKRVCSNICQGLLAKRSRSESVKSITKCCSICGDVFTPTDYRHVVCYKTHYRTCTVCGIDFDITTRTGATCSDDCEQAQREATTLKRTGHRHPGQSEEAKAKNRATCQERYGVDNGSKSESARRKLSEQLSVIMNLPETHEKRRQTCQELYGVDHHLMAESVIEARKRTCKIRYGVDNVCKSPVILATQYDRYFERTGYRNPSQNPDVIRRKTKSMLNTIALDGTRLDSKYELDVYEMLLRIGVPVERQIPIKYEHEGAEHTTFIDFKIGDVLFECKGGHLMGGTWDDRNVPIATKLSVYRQHHVIVVTDSGSKHHFGKPNSAESNGLRYLHKCPEPLIGVDIELFRRPEFPYSKDRPKCFYDVRVDGNPSAYQAFNDEAIRWKMIMNRIQYSGGFIDAQQVLVAMNVTRVSKQPSWFSAKFASDVISKYATSTVIVDPFAGWGGRAEGAARAGRYYIGIDLSEELVAWHQQNGRNISLGDAKEFKYTKPCTVFICPPYQDKEVYFETQDSGLTQCEWLQIVMDNIPTAQEYIMVCKVVDPGWEQYIVDTKKNKSHFGQNNEYVLVVHNKVDNLIY